MIDKEALGQALNAFRAYSPDPNAGIYTTESVTGILTAYLDAMKAKGWKMVPREPTPEMAETGGRAWVHPSVYMGGAPKIAIRDATRVYRAMFDSASPGAEEK